MIAQRIIREYVDGKPKQEYEHTVEGKTAELIHIYLPEKIKLET